MKKKHIYKNIIFFIILSVFSITINNHYGNIGVFPIDTFAFFDTGYNIILGKHPFKDFWVTTGPLVDYIQALFFTLFGLSWSSYVIHASIFNFLITISIYLTLVKFELNPLYAFLYSLSVAILCYPVAGTPFAYQHSFIFSVISLMIFFLALKTNNKIFWFILPFLMVFGFLSMHVPSAYINLTIVIFTLIYFYLEPKILNIYSFILGSVASCLLVFFFFILFEIPFLKFFQQYFLFPMSMGEFRLSNPDYAYSLNASLTFRGVIGHFKFIHIFLIFNIFTMILLLRTKGNFARKENIIIYSCLIISTLLFIFHQLITANQTFIFSLIPILGGFFHILLEKYFSKKFVFQFVSLLIILFVTFKYNNEYNLKRKFMDLQNVNLSQAIDAKIINKKFDNLKWITPFFSGKPEDEIRLIKGALNEIEKDKRKIMIITQYQFFSLILERDLNIPNRWYGHENASHPFKGHPYFEFYRDHLNSVIGKNDIEVIYTVGKIKIDDFSDYLEGSCFKKKKINDISFSNSRVPCN